MMAAPVDILVFGSAIVDFICYVERLPKAGETLHGQKFANGFGGKGANQCVAAARLGARTALIAKLGEDAWGASYSEHLRAEDVNVQFVERCKGEATGIAQINVAASGENSIVIVVGVNNLLSPADVLKATELFNSAKVLICQLETPLSATIAALRQFKGISILNAAPALSDTPPELLKETDILCVNESEAALMIGSASDIVSVEQAKGALGKLLQMGASTVIITLGEQGAVFATQSDDQRCIHVPAPKVTSVVDTTGAGDAFIGALAYFLARHADLPLHQQIGAACVVAAHSVQYPGTQSSFPTAAQIPVDFEQTPYEWRPL